MSGGALRVEAGRVDTFTVRRRGSDRGGTMAAARPRQYSRDEILEAIRTWARCYGESPTLMDWEPARARRLGHEWRAQRFESGQWPTARMVRWQFGLFNDAVLEAGLKPRRAPARIRPNLCDAEAITDAIVEWTRRYGDVPCMADWDPVRARRLQQEWRIARYNDGDWPSARSVAHWFGSFADAVQAAGLVPRPRSSTREQRATARQENRLAVASLRRTDGPHDVPPLADAVRAVVAGRRVGDPIAVHAALIDVAAAALADADRAAAGL